jgi:hypothetical protein
LRGVRADTRGVRAELRAELRADSARVRANSAQTPRGIHVCGLGSEAWEDVERGRLIM